MNKLSVIIIAKNEQRHIEACIKSAQLISSDIVVVDSGSTDATIKIAKREGATVINTVWNGYGAARNKGAKNAKNDWIFSLDSDERITPQLARTILKLSYNNPYVVYKFKRLSFIGNKVIRYGSWGSDKVSRLYNKNATKWNLDFVHEDIETLHCKVQHVQDGKLLHYTCNNIEDLYSKVYKYAELSARVKYAQKKKSTWFKCFFSPLFGFIKNYIFRLGFLDGKEGCHIALSDAYYTYYKYSILRQLHLKLSP